MKKKLLLFSALFLSVPGGLFAQTQLFGLTYMGGVNGIGAIFRMDPSGSNYQVVHDFQSPAGYNPVGNLCTASDGNIYGVCEEGGPFASCTVFRFEPYSNVYTDVYSFNLANYDGYDQNSGVIEGPGGILYGSSMVGGFYGGGTLYKYNINTQLYSNIYGFGNVTGEGYYPSGGLLLSGNKLYGFNSSDDTGYGTMYSFDLSASTCSALHLFNGTDGKTPSGAPMMGSNGMIYGMTTTGGSDNAGTIFNYDPAGNVFTKLVDLDTTTGSLPLGSLVQAPSGMMYGMTSEGGAFGNGVIFSFDPSNNSYTNIYDLSLTDGITPRGDLVVSGSRLYGMTSDGGVNSAGTAFYYDLSNGSFHKIVDFGSSAGMYPRGALLPFTFTGVKEQEGNSMFSVFPNPVGNELTIRLDQPGNEPETFTLKNILGEAVMSWKENDPSAGLTRTVDCSQLASGVYSLEMSDTRQHYSQKIIKR